MGVSSITDYLPDMTTISSETWLKALIDPDYSPDQALEYLLHEWNALGYEDIKGELNAKAAELGYWPPAAQ